LRFRLSTILLLMIPLAVLSFCLSLAQSDRPIKWVDYSKANLTRSLEENHPVMIYFSADWDLTSVYNEKDSIDTWWVRHLLRKNRVVTMRADMTNRKPDVVDELESIGRQTVPVIAIYTPGAGSSPSILDGLMTEEQLCDALRNIKNGR